MRDAPSPSQASLVGIPNTLSTEPVVLNEKQDPHARNVPLPAKLGSGDQSESGEGDRALHAARLVTMQSYGLTRPPAERAAGERSKCAAWQCALALSANEF
jgi:hypothetical protein